MSSHAVLPTVESAADAGLPEPIEVEQGARRPQSVRTRKGPPAPSPIRFPAQATPEDGTYRQAELFYLQKQIQSQTPMVVVLEDGEHVEGCIEWYDRSCLKIRGRNKTIVYKAAIKYMYKLGEQGL
jgi:sRNA-binding regulator protein Hfq